MNPKYTPEYFIKKFKAIPEDLWITDKYTDAQETKCCAMGHCGARNQMSPDDVLPEEADALCDLFIHGLSITVGGVNDGHYPEYQQPTPKQRVLAALRDIAKGGK